MTDKNLLMQKCLEITCYVLNNDQRAFINIKIGNSFCFKFNNQETSIDTRKKSPSVIKRDNERKELFKEKMKEEKLECNEGDTENNIGETINDNDQIQKVKVFTDDIMSKKRKTPKCLDTVPSLKINIVVVQLKMSKQG